MTQNILLKHFVGLTKAPTLIYLSEVLASYLGNKTIKLTSSIQKDKWVLTKKTILPHSDDYSEAQELTTEQIFKMLNQKIDTKQDVATLLSKYDPTPEIVYSVYLNPLNENKPFIYEYEENDYLESTDIENTIYLSICLALLTDIDNKQKNIKINIMFNKDEPYEGKCLNNNKIKFVDNQVVGLRSLFKFYYSLLKLH